MCDRHNQKEKNHYCLEHEELMCAQCASEEHCQTPCESLPLVNAGKHIYSQVGFGESELKKLKGVTQSILDGKQQDATLRTIHDVETLLEEYVEDVKRKLNKAKLSIQPFSELSSEERWKLKAVATKKIPNGQPTRDDADVDAIKDTVVRLQEIRKQTKAAKAALYSLPNYVEVSVNDDFLKTLKFEGKPVNIIKNGEIEGDDENDDSATVYTKHAVPQESVYLIEKSTVSLEHCTDIIMMEEYIIASVGDSVQKRDRKRMSFRQGLSVRGAGILSVLGNTTEVAVLQNTGSITIIDTAQKLVVLFTIRCEVPYFSMCYVESVTGAPRLPRLNPVFVVCYNQRDIGMTDYVDLIHAKPTKYPGKPPTFAAEVTAVVDSDYGKNRYRFREISSVCATQRKTIVVASSKGVTCVSKTGNLIWTIDLFKQITQVMSFRTLVFVSVQNEERVLTIGNQGHVIDQNIIPSGSVVPEKLSAYDDILMVKEFKKHKWVIFKQMFETV